MPPYKGHAKATRIIETQNCECSDNLGGGLSWELLDQGVGAGLAAVRQRGRTKRKRLILTSC